MGKKHYRGNVEVVRDILNSAKNEQTRYRLQRLTDTNQEQFDKYANPLIELGYLEVSGRKTLQTTSEGLIALKTLDEASTIIEEVKKHLK